MFVLEKQKKVWNYSLNQINQKNYDFAAYVI